MRIHDLTQVLRPGMRGVETEPKFTIARDGWNAATWHLYSHTGTHMDAQVHFDAGPETIDQHTPERCMGPCWVVDLPALPPKALLTIASLGSIAEKHRPGDSLLLRTYWHRHAENPAIYRDALPRISDELAEWCVSHRVKLLAVEPPSVADVTNLPEVTRIHKILLSGGVTIVEGLTNTAAITSEKFYLIALPLRLASGDGSPVRALAIETPHDNPFA